MAETYEDELRRRLAKLNILTLNPRGVDYERVSAFAPKDVRKSGNVNVRVKSSRPQGRAYELIEERALVIQELNRIKRNKMQEFDLNLYIRATSMDDAQLIRWIKEETGRNWSTKRLRYKIAEIERQISEPASKPPPKIERKRRKRYDRPTPKPGLKEMFKQMMKRVPVDTITRKVNEWKDVEQNLERHKEAREISQNPSKMFEGEP